MSADKPKSPAGPSPERIAKGEEMFAKLYGGAANLPPPEHRDAYINDVLAHVLGEIWSRDVLSVRDRRLLVLGSVIALGEHGVAETQLRAAHARGELTREQLSEVLLFMAYYVGNPRVSGLQQVINRILAETKA